MTPNTILALHEKLKVDVHLAARALPPWPAGEPRPTEEDLDAMERLADYGDCGRCVTDAKHFPEITAEDAAAANAANAARPPSIFVRRPVLPRAAYTEPARIECYCAHVDQTGYGWPAYGAMKERWPAQQALRDAYNKVSDLLPQLRVLIAARWIDREAVLKALGGPDVAVVERAGAESETDFWCDAEPRNDGSLHFGDASGECVIPFTQKQLQRLMLALVNEMRPDGFSHGHLAKVWAEQDRRPTAVQPESIARYARELRDLIEPQGLRDRIQSNKNGARLDRSASTKIP